MTAMDPHAQRYARFMPAELRTPLVEPRSEWMPLPSGTTLHLFRHPAPAGEERARLVVLHGGGGHGRMLAAVGVAAQHAGLGAVAPDLPGYGHTDVPDVRGVRYRDWVDAAAAVVEAEASDGIPVVVIGASMGGRLALDVAHRLGPGAVGACIATCLLDPRRPDAAAVLARHELLLRIGLPVMRATAPVVDRRLVPIRWLAPMEDIANDAELARTCIRDPLGAGTRVPIGFLRSWLDHDPGYEPASFAAAPVVLAHPGADRWTPLPVSASWFDELTVDKELIVLEGCGHFPVEPGAVPGLSAALEAALGFAIDR
jgi:alpha-beta hydrolase superfamily lysophospholipase